MIDLRNKLKKHPTKTYSRRNTKLTHLIIHHSYTTGGDAYSFARYHVDTRGWPGIGYAYVILKDGTIQWCHEHDVRTYHVGKYNGPCLGICLVGNYDEEEIPHKQWESAVWLTHVINLPNILGHRELSGVSKSCPGTKFNMSDFRNDVRNI